MTIMPNAFLNWNTINAKAGAYGWWAVDAAWRWCARCRWIHLNVHSSWTMNLYGFSRCGWFSSVGKNDTHSPDCEWGAELPNGQRFAAQRDERLWDEGKVSRLSEWDQAGRRCQKHAWRTCHVGCSKERQVKLRWWTTWHAINAEVSARKWQVRWWKCIYSG